MTNEIHMEILIKTLPLGLCLKCVNKYNIKISNILY